MTKIDPKRCLALVRAWASKDGASMIALDDVLEVCDLAESALRGVEAARAALRKAVQIAEICSDWNLDEVEIDGNMVRSHELAAEFRAALSQEEKVTP